MLLGWTAISFEDDSDKNPKTGNRYFSSRFPNIIEYYLQVVKQAVKKIPEIHGLDLSQWNILLTYKLLSKYCNYCMSTKWKKNSLNHTDFCLFISKSTEAFSIITTCMLSKLHIMYSIRDVSTLLFHHYISGLFKITSKATIT